MRIKHLTLAFLLVLGCASPIGFKVASPEGRSATSQQAEEAVSSQQVGGINWSYVGTGGGLAFAMVASVLIITRSQESKCEEHEETLRHVASERHQTKRLGMVAEIKGGNKDDLRT